MTRVVVTRAAGFGSDMNSRSTLVSAQARRRKS